MWFQSTSILWKSVEEAESDLYREQNEDQGKRQRQKHRLRQTHLFGSISDQLEDHIFSNDGNVQSLALRETKKTIEDQEDI